MSLFFTVRRVLFMLMLTGWPAVHAAVIPLIENRNVRISGFVAGVEEAERMLGSGHFDFGVFNEALTLQLSSDRGGGRSEQNSDITPEFIGGRLFSFATATPPNDDTFAVATAVFGLTFDLAAPEFYRLQGSFVTSGVSNRQSRLFLRREIQDDVYDDIIDIQAGSLDPDTSIDVVLALIPGRYALTAHSSVNSLSTLPGLGNVTGTALADFTFQPVNAEIPEPATVMMVLLALASLSVIHCGISARRPPQPISGRRTMRFIRLGGTAVLLTGSLFAGNGPAAVSRKPPFSFERVTADGDRNPRFLGRGKGYTLLLKSSEALLSLSAGPTPEFVRLQFIGSNPAARIEGIDRMPGTINRFRGSDPAQWRTGASQFARVQYRDLYPGIDLVFYGKEGELEYDFAIAPGADPSRIRLRFEGARKVDNRGADLVLRTRNGEIVQRAPVAWQDLGGQRQLVSARYLRNGKEVTLTLGSYDREKSLLVDPVLTYSTFFGGASVDTVENLVTDTAGNIYVTGFTQSGDLPVTGGVTGASYRGGNSDAYVAKFSRNGSLIYSTYLGGTGGDTGRDIAVDAMGNAYVTGDTASSDFPTTPGAYQGAGRNRQTDAFVVKLNPAGSAMLYSTLVGGSGPDLATAIAIDAAGNAYALGQTQSADFPTMPNAVQASLRGLTDLIVFKLNAAGSALLYSTYLGGTGGELPGSGIAVDGVGNAHVSGNTTSLDYPTTPGVLQPLAAFGRFGVGFITKLNAGGTGLVYSTYLGGTGVFDYAQDLSLDRSGNAYVVGSTSSTDFPVTSQAIQPTFGGESDAFVTKLNSQGTALLYSTYLGGSGDESAASIAIDASGQGYVVGVTTSRDFPVTRDAIQTVFGGFITGDGFIARLSAGGETLNYATYLGGPGADSLRTAALDPDGVLVVGGTTDWPNFPVTSNSFRSAHAGGIDGVIAKITFEPVSSSTPSFTAAGIANAASFRAGAVAPGEIVTLFGSGFGPPQIVALRLKADGTVEDTLAGTRVLFDGVPAPLIYVVANQLSAVVPYSVAGRSTTQVEIEYQGRRSTPAPVAVAASAPAIFTLNASGSGPGAILNQDGSLNAASNRAARGAVVVIYATGEGRTVPEAVTGSVTGANPPRPVLGITVRIGGVPAEILYAGAAPGLIAGVLQINARVPQDASTGAAVPISVTAGTETSPAGVTIAVQ